MPPKNKNIVQGIQKYFLLTTLVVLMGLLLVFIKPFWTDLLFAGVTVAAIYPLHKWILKKQLFPKTVSALVTLILIFALIITPFTFFFFFIAGQAGDAYFAVSQRVNELTNNDITLLPDLIRESRAGEWINDLIQYAPISTNDLIESGKQVVGRISALLIDFTTAVLTQIPVVLIHIIVFLLMMFYFIRDGERLIKAVQMALPLPQKHRKEVFQKLNELSYAIIYGIFGAAIAQGFLVGLAFSFAGISNAAFWGAIAALFSPLPYIGTAIIWFPAVAMLYVTGQHLTATLLLLWCVGVVSFADNLIKPYLIGSSTRIHPLAVLLVILGGVLMFGLKGLFFGPLVLTLGLTFLHIYELEYKSVLKK